MTEQVSENPFKFLEKTIEINGENFIYFDISHFKQISKLPFSIRVLLESAIRNADNFHVKESDVYNILNWVEYKGEGSVNDNEYEIPFKPARVLLQDFTGVPALVDLAAMRDSVLLLGGNPEKINPICASDLVIDHSIAVDFSRTNDSLKKNQDLEFERNKERFQFLKWGQKAFNSNNNQNSKLQIIPPGSGICHQVNLEYLARVVFNDLRKDGKRILYNDSCVGTDSHTTMINGLGVLGYGVGGIEAEAVMMGQSIQFLLPEVIGYKLEGNLSPYVTSTDLVLTITKNLRSLGVVGKFVEFFGKGVSFLSIADRATIANMTPEFGGTCSFFPVDKNALDYLRITNRDESKINIIEQYLRATMQFREYDDESQDPIYSKVITLDLSDITSSMSGPKRPQDRVPVSEMKKDFSDCLTNKVGFKGFGLSENELSTEAYFTYDDGIQYKLKHGSVVIAAITSCTNTSNPSVMLGAGLLAKNAVQAGLKVAPYIKTSLSPGSGVVQYYLKESGVIDYLENLGFGIVGYGCMTCIGNSGGLHQSVADVIEINKIIACGILSGNRNFEGRIHPLTRANYLASPLLVIAYALAGTVDINFETQPIGVNESGKEIYLKEIWPTRNEIQDVEKKFVLPAMFRDVYDKITLGSKNWQELVAPESNLYPWDENSTYIKSPPFFSNMTRELPPQRTIINARVLLNLGDSITTDHISPAGSIARNSCAARYLMDRGLAPKDFNSYGSRRGNDAVMSRGTFANIRLVNKMMQSPGPKTIHFPSGDEMDIYDCAMRYKEENVPLILLAGAEYGSGSSRDWAAKGPFLLGIRAVIAESYERIHRSNLIGMGIVPFEYLKGENASTLGLNANETFTINMPQDFKPHDIVSVETSSGISFKVKGRLDTEVEITYYKHGGILNYMIRKMIE